MVDTHVNETRRRATGRDHHHGRRRNDPLRPVAARGLLSHSNFGSSDSASAQKMRAALPSSRNARRTWKWTAKCTAIRRSTASCARNHAAFGTEGDANLLVMPNIDAANIAYNLLKTAAGNGIAVGPILLGCAKPVHILTPSATVRRIVNMTALCVVDAVAQRKA
jgi:malate dehydrogenase (oxaloacetate-decarboxylating)(NADP+)